MSNAALEPLASGDKRADSIASLTGIRFIAALTIVLGHTYSPVAVVMAIGMPLFFTLSGFIIHYVYSAEFAGGWRTAALRFAGARFSRIYPLYFMLLLVAVAMTPMGLSLYHAADIRAILAYVFACWTWVPLSIDGHAAADWYYSISWSVPTEIFFYCGYALVFYRIAGLRSAKTCFVMLVGFCIGAYLLFYVLFLTRDGWESWLLAHVSGFTPRTDNFNNSLYRWLLYTSPYGRIFEFIGGCLTCQLYLLLRGTPAARRLPVELLGWFACVLMAVLVAVFWWAGPREPWLAPDDSRLLSFFVSLHMNFLLAPCCYLLIFALAFGRSSLSRLLSTGLAVLLGEISYSTYLGHPLAQSFVGNSTLGHIRHASTIITVVVIYIFSWMFYAALEVPAKTALRRLFARRRPKPLARGVAAGGQRQELR
jgi:peptidoglycan/LPS O-acetylase OafA/YrhL